VTKKVIRLEGIRSGSGVLPSCAIAVLDVTSATNNIQRYVFLMGVLS
jgi:hypothetical protein